MAITKLLLAAFVRPELLAEAFALRTPEEQVSAYKQSLLDTLRFMQGTAYKILTNPADKANLSYAFQKYLHNLDLIQKYFESISDDTMVELIKANKTSFVSAVNRRILFKPIIWSRNLEVETDKLPPKFLNPEGMPAQQYRGASTFYAPDAPLTDKIALTRK
jgi:hypothetical protein